MAIAALFTLLLAAPTAGSGQGGCPPNSAPHREVREGRDIVVYCRCVPGFVKVGPTCQPYEAWLGQIQRTMVAERAEKHGTLGKISSGMESLTPPSVAMSDLMIGDVLLPAPADPVGFLIDILTGKHGASHALTYLGRAPTGMLFLDHTAFNPFRPEVAGGMHIIGEREFRQQYGARPLYAARVLEQVDGRRLLQEAVTLASRDTRLGGWRSFRPTTFSLVGTTEDNAACSVRAAMVVFKATGSSATDLDTRLKSLQIWDLSPNSFFDRERLGKHFVTFPLTP